MTKAEYMQKHEITITPATWLDRQFSQHKYGKEYGFIVNIGGTRFSVEKGTVKEVRACYKKYRYFSRNHASRMRMALTRSPLYAPFARTN